MGNPRSIRVVDEPLTSANAAWSSDVWAGEASAWEMASGGCCVLPICIGINYVESGPAEWSCVEDIAVGGQM